MLADFINGSFEAVGSIVLWLNVRQLYRDKRYNGVTTWATTWFMLWGYWNLYYYPSLNQWWSLAGGVSIVTANTVWLALMFYYGRGDE